MDEDGAVALHPVGWDIYNNHSTYHYWKDRCAVNAFSIVVRSHEFLITGFAGGGGGGAKSAMTP